METRTMLNLEYLAKKYDQTAIPLYLSYPTTSWWKEAVTQEHYIEAFDPNRAPLLYFHFPYCRKSCHYCCCYKIASADPSDLTAYIEYLTTEFSQTLTMLGAKGRISCTQMHWGGGTPTLLSGEQIRQVFGAIAQRVQFGDEKESSISIEAFPDQKLLSDNTLQSIRSVGFNEISFGVQDFDRRIQESINRDSPVEVVAALVDQAQNLGLRVHIDLCYGLPFQGPNELEQTLLKVCSLAPDRIALFAYAHFPQLFIQQRLIPSSAVPNSFMRVLMHRLAQEVLIGQGYRMVGIDHFVKEDNSLHRAQQTQTMVKDFMGYSEQRRKNVLGFGYCAISRSEGRYFHNTTSLSDYCAAIDAGRLPLDCRRSHTLTRDDMIREAVLLQGILCNLHVDKRAIEKTWGIDFDRYFADENEELAGYQADGLCAIDGDGITVTGLGKSFARHIAFVFDRYYKQPRIEKSAD